MDRYINKFLIISTLGRSNLDNALEDIKKIDCDKLILGCVKKAYDDMMTIGRFFKITDKEKKCKKIKKIIEKNDYEFQRNIIDDVAENVFKGEYKRTYTNKNGNTIEQSTNSFALSQKVINMTFKYLLCCQYLGFLSDDKINFKKCDCPIDSIILNGLNSEDKGSNIKWSQISSNDYIKIQNSISNKTDLENLEIEDIGNLKYDFQSW